MTPNRARPGPTKPKPPWKPSAPAFELNVDAARPIYYGDPYYDLSHKRVLNVPGAGILSCLTVVPLGVRIGGVPVPAGGIAGVATQPEFQRQGHAAALSPPRYPHCGTNCAIRFPC